MGSARHSRAIRRATGRPTQSDVAREAGVSRALVSMALAGSSRVAPATRALILDAANRLGYSRDLSAAMLASNSSPVVGVILPNLFNPFFEDLIACVQHSADEVGLLPLLATASNEVSREEMVMRRFRELRVRGVITISPALPREVLRVYGSQVPLVVIGDADIGGMVDTIRLDEDAAAHDLMAHLHQRGWDAVTYVFDSASQRDRGLERRRLALEAASADEGLHLNVCAVDRGLAPVFSDLIAPARRGRLALVAHNDLLATQLVSGARGEGLAVGRDIAVVGFDNTRLSRSSEANTTSVAQDTEGQAALAVDNVVTRAARPSMEGRNRVFPPHLVRRGST